MDIDNIPKKYGGNLDFECGKMPVLDAAVKNVLDLASPDLEQLFLTAPVKWIDDVDGDMTAVGVGSIDGKERRETVATLHSFAKLALSRSNRPRIERAPTNTNPQSYLAGGASPSLPVFQQESKQQDMVSPPGMTVTSAEPVPQLHQVTETRVPIEEPTSNFRPPIEAQPLPQSQAITQGQLEDRNGVFTGNPVVPAQTGIDGPAPQMMAMPPPKFERTQTEFMTPAEEPSQMQAFP